MASDWRKRAACREVPAEKMDAVFFPWETMAKDEADYTEARSYCDRCPVRNECLAEALIAERNVSKTSRFGFFGGKTPRERWALSGEAELRDGQRACGWCKLPYFPARVDQTVCGESCRRGLDRSLRRERRLQRERIAS